MKENGPCPVRKAAELMSDTWTMLIMRDLNENPRRFCELERSLEGISTRTLALKLKKLERDGLIEKTGAGVYAPTKKGAGLKIVSRAMKRYAEAYL